MFKNRDKIDLRIHGFREWLGTHDPYEIASAPGPRQRKPTAWIAGQFEEAPEKPIALDKAFADSFGDLNGEKFKLYLQTVSEFGEMLRLQMQEAPH